MISQSPRIEFPVDALLDQSVDRQAGAPPGVLADLVNLRKDKTGALVKRYGETKTSDVPFGENGAVRLGSRGDTVLRCDKDAAYWYSQESDVWAGTVGIPGFSLDTEPRLIAAASDTSMLFAACASAGGVTLHVWDDGDAFEGFFAVIDEANGSVLRGPTRFTTGGDVILLTRVATDGTNFWLFALKAGTLYGWYTTPAALLAGTALGGGSALGTDVTATSATFDVAPCGANRVAIVYNHDAGGGGVGFKLLVRDETLGAVASSTQTLTALRSLTVFSRVGLSFIWVGYVITSSPNQTVMRLFDTSATLLDDANGVLATAAVLTQGFAYDSATRVLQVVGDATVGDPTGKVYAAYQLWNGSAIVPGSQSEKLGGLLSGYPYLAGTRTVAWVDIFTTGLDRAPYQHTVLVNVGASGAAMTPEMVIAQGTASTAQYAATFHATQKSYASSVNAAEYPWVSASPARRTDSNSIVAYSATEYRPRLISPMSGPAHTIAEAAGLAVLSGGVQPQAFDSQAVVEIGFPFAPLFDPATVATPSASGGVIAAGSYQYAATYEYNDAAGLRHQSAPMFSDVVTHATGSTNSVTLAIPSLRMTRKADGPLVVAVWRTTTGPGSIFYLVGVVENNAATATVSFVDTFSDGSVSTNEILYTTAGELANQLPPPLYHAVSFSNRLAGIDAEHRDRIVFSKPLKVGRGPEFSGALETYVRGIGPLTALAEMDGSLFAFSATHVAIAAYGDGQDATGAGQWPTPQVVTRACGCIDPRALCVSQDGVVFASRDATDTVKIWLLPRGGSNPIEIGAKVQDYLTGTAVGFATQARVDVAAICNWAAESRVMVTITANAEDSVTLEYDYGNRGPDGFGVWSAKLGAAEPSGVSAAAVVAGRHWTGKRDADDVYYSDPERYDDDGTWIAYRIQTHDIRISGSGNGAYPTVNGKINTINYQLDERGGNARTTLTVTQDAGASIAFVNRDTAVAAVARKNFQWQPPVRRSTSGFGFGLVIESSRLDAGVSANSQDVVPRSVSVEYRPLPGAFRPLASERI